MDILIDFVSRFLQDRNEDDAFDRLNYQITPFLFVLLSLVNISKLYIGSAINCFTKAEFRGGWVQYTHDYCLIENTYYLRTDESIPVEQEVRGQKQIAYYQWVPFILVLQACSFYVPHLLWRSFNWVTGYQIRAVVATAKEAAAGSQSLGESQPAVIKLARSLFHASQLRHRTLHILPKQQFVSLLYLSMKFSYVLLICFHLCVFKYFLGNLDFALGFLRHRGEWQQTGHFPRVTVCDLTVYKYGQPVNFSVECVLPLNMVCSTFHLILLIPLLNSPAVPTAQFNEKIFVFFFFWLCLLLALTLFSLALWMFRLQNRSGYFRKLLAIQSRNEPPPPLDTAKMPLLMDGRGSDGERSPLPDLFQPAALFGHDLRVVLGLIQDQAGLLFCARLFREICNIRNERVHQSKNASPPPFIAGGVQ